jgi:hypothetical protein
VLSAHEQGVSSFAVEQIFRESWLDVVVRRSRAANLSGTRPITTASTMSIALPSRTC